MQSGERQVLVLGVGNLLWADEGFGVRCADALAAKYRSTDELVILDGGTQGLALVPDVARATHLILLDAVDVGVQPGTLVVARDSQVRGYIGSDKMSLHQAGLTDVLACVELMGKAPQRVTLIGVQPVELEDYGGSLTAPVRAQLGPAIALAEAELRSWGVLLVERENGPDSTRPDVDAAVLTSMENYERGRPGEVDACRTGDARVLQRSRPDAPADTGRVP